MMRLLLVAVVVLVTSGHIGDNNTWFRGTAGPYAVQVTVRHPGVVPGLADILVRVDGNVSRVTVRPVKFPQGLEGSPRPDVAKPVPGSPGLYSAELWFMERGAYSVHVAVEGSAGTGIVAVPVNSLSTERLQLSAGLGAVLVALGLFLALGLITIVRAAVRESVLPPGEAPTPRHVLRGRIATGIATAMVAVLLWGGAAWWDAEDTAYGETIWQPMRIDTRVQSHVLTLAIVDERWLSRSWTPIVPDHGRMMHLFLVRLPAMDVFAHLHPDAVHTDSFRVSLPPLPAGAYVLYGDVVHESGFAQTLTDTVILPPPAATPAQDPAADDAYWIGGASSATTSPTAVLPGGLTLTWERPARIAAGEELELRFTARAADGATARLEPYMGMPAHAVVRRDDGAVFVHLHSTGSVPLAAQEAQTAQLAVASPGAAPALHAQHAGGHDEVVIPYAFPEPGRYRLWLQVRQSGTVHTAAWDVAVDAR